MQAAQLEFKAELIFHESGDMSVTYNPNEKSIGFHWIPFGGQGSPKPYLHGGIDPKNIKKDVTRLVNDRRVWLPEKDKAEAIVVVCAMAMAIYEIPVIQGH